MPQIAQTQKTVLRVERGADGRIVLDGWCEVGSTVFSNFYESEAKTPQKVIKIHVWTGDKQAVVWTDGGGEQNRALGKIDFQDWVKQEPIGSPGEKKS